VESFSGIGGVSRMGGFLVGGIKNFCDRRRWGEDHGIWGFFRGEGIRGSERGVGRKRG
jgi:hypothetical protein